jgi:hypothetical protein
MRSDKADGDQRIMFAMTPNSASAERVFSLLKAMFVLAEGQLEEAALLAQQAYEASGAAAALLALGEVLHRQGKPQ